MFDRLTVFLFFMLALPAFLMAAELNVEILDNEENTLLGAISAINQEQITVTVNGTDHVIPFVKLVKIRNIAPNPFGDSSFDANNSGQHHTVPLTFAPGSTTRGESERRTAAQLKVLQSREQIGQHILPDSMVVLELKDGSRLVADSFTTTNNQGVFRLLNQQNDLTLPLNCISAIRFAVRSLSESINPPADWQRLAVPDAKGDRLVVGNAEAFDVYTGILNEVKSETISFIIDEESLPVPRRKVFGLVLHHESPSIYETPLATITLWTGTKCKVADIRLNGNDLTWQTSFGLSAVVPLEMVREIDFGEKKMTYLTEIEWARSEFALPFGLEIKPALFPLLQTFYAKQTKNSPDEAIIDGNVYERSILLRGKTQLEYLLPKSFVSLKAVIGIEDQYRPYASAMLQILADSQLLGTWTLRGDSSSERIHLNLPQHCRLVTIIVEPPLGSHLPAVLTIADPKLFE